MLKPSGVESAKQSLRSSSPATSLGNTGSSSERNGAGKKDDLGIEASTVLNELWSCMSKDLQILANNQGGRQGLTNEDCMMDRIRHMAVTRLQTNPDEV